jgi:hypothetical protein
MAKVSGPFMSVDASGTIYGVLTASIWKGRNYIRGHVVPTNKKTDAQKVVRQLLATAVAAWQALVVVEPVSGGTGAKDYKSGWNTAAQDCQPAISGFNYFVQQYCLTGAAPTIPLVAPKKSKSIHGGGNYGLDKGYTP